MPRDRLFRSQQPAYESFEFNRSVARVFDDMVQRSVPGYEEAQDLMARLALSCHPGGAIYDLGCSTGTTLLRIAELSQEPLPLVGVDQSQAMLEVCRAKTEGHPVRLVQADIETFPLEEPGIVVLSLVAQFLRPVRRQALIRRIHDSLLPGGALLMLEKTVLPEPRANALFIELHHEFKRSAGYSRLEIRRKRETLENRLIPFQPQENLQMLTEAGFQEVSLFFSRLNFQGYLALRQCQQQDADKTDQHAEALGPPDRLAQKSRGDHQGQQRLAGGEKGGHGKRK